MTQQENQSKFSGMQVKLTFWFLVLSLVPLALVGYFANNLAASSLQNAYFNSLKAIAESRETHIADYLKDLTMLMESLAERRVFREKTEIRTIAGELAFFQKKFPNFLEVFLLDGRGKIVASSNQRSVGVDRSNFEYFIVAIKGEKHITDPYVSDVFKEIGLTVAVPVRDPGEDRVGRVLVGRVSLDRLNAITTDDVGMGKSGETYIVNKAGLMLTESRFEKGKVLKQKVDSRPFRAWRDEGKEYVGLHRDYRGGKTVGATMSESFRKELNKEWLLIAEVDESEAFAGTYFIRWMIFLFMLLAMAAVSVSAYYVAKGITSPIVYLSGVLRRVEEGELGVEIVRSSLKDEVGQLINDAAGMVGKLRGLISGIKKGGVEITGASTEMQAQIQEQISGAAEQSSAVAETSSAIAELSQTATNISRIAQEVQKFSESTLGIINDANAKVNETAQKILALGEKSQNINEIVKMINDLSDQINLLALNAKIEAARAGEAGKGFAVVATEISKLADRSAESTDQIRQLVGEIQAETSSAVMGVEESVKRGARGGEMVQQAVQKVKEITMSTQQQQTASDQVMVAVKNIDTVAKNFVDSTKQTALATEKLNRLAESLRKEVEQFKL